MAMTTAEKLFHQLHHGITLLHRGYSQHEGQGECGSHRGKGRIISLLRAKDGISEKELAEMLTICPSRLSEVLDKLAAKGLIERRQRSEDKSVSKVFITERGNEAAARVEAARQSVSDALLAGLSPQEQESLSGLLSKLTSALTTKLGATEESCQCGQGYREEKYHCEACGHEHGKYGWHHHCEACGHEYGRRHHWGHGEYGEGCQIHGHGHGETGCPGCHECQPQKESEES